MMNRPALLIELKWNKSAEKAISQIEARDYTRLARQFAYKGDMLFGRDQLQCKRPEAQL